jgi:hypothetical protein
MSEEERTRRFRIVISDEETGDVVASATGVETCVVLAVPDTLEGDSFRRILLGDAEASIQLLFEIVRGVTESIGSGVSWDVSELLDDHLLMEITEGMPAH